MKKKIGNLLVENGLVVEKDLEEALQRQVIFGGRLGTNLMEMGVLAEEVLLKVLAGQYNVPYAEPHMFENIPKGVAESVPADLVDRHGVVPINKEKNRIILAMIDPTRLDVIDEVAFRTACIVKPVVATELRITQALERYYGIRRDLRYLSIAAPGPRREEEAAQVISFEAGIPIAWPAGKQAPPAATPPAAPPHPPQAPAAAGPLPPSAPAAAPPPSAIPADRPIPPLPEPEDPHSLDSITLRMQRVTNRDQVADLLVEAGLRFLDGVLIFILKGEEAIGWRAGGMVAIKDISQWKVKLERHSILTLVQDSRTMFRGPGRELFHTNPWLAPASAVPPQEAVTIPLVIKGRAVTALMGFSEKRLLRQEEMEFLMRLMRKATVSFEILILQSKLMML